MKLNINTTNLVIKWDNTLLAFNRALNSFYSNANGKTSFSLTLLQFHYNFYFHYYYNYIGKTLNIYNIIHSNAINAQCS